jgi:hypothetical protein
VYGTVVNGDSRRNPEYLNTMYCLRVLYSEDEDEDDDDDDDSSEDSDPGKRTPTKKDGAVDLSMLEDTPVEVDKLGNKKAKLLKAEGEDAYGRLQKRALKKSDKEAKPARNGDKHSKGGEQTRSRSQGAGKVLSLDADSASEASVESDSDSDDDDDDDGDDDGSDSDGDWRDGKTQKDLKEEADRILKICDKISVGLRQSLQQWKGEGATATAADTAVTAAKGADDCIDLMVIDESAATSDIVLRQSDIEVLCPNLVLKAYQLVGVNWLKLLNMNDVNGVLAGEKHFAAARGSSVVRKLYRHVCSRA